MTLLLLAIGTILLLAGADALVRGTSRMAKVAGISPLVVGLTVVAYGTSAPELAVSVGAALQNRAELAVGNVVGSNTFNVLFILGLSALVTPLAVPPTLLRWDLWLMVGISALLAVAALDGRISRIEGALLCAGCLAYSVIAVVRGRRGAAPAAQRPEERRGHWTYHAMVAAIGLGMLVLGAHWLVQGAVGVAKSLGVGELVIGLTIVAAGTSLPEAATSVIAGLRGEREIAVGNVVGSNIFNILGVLGAASVVAPDGVAVPSAALAFDIPVMIVAAAACIPVFLSGQRIDRWEGALLVGFYVAYLVYTVLAALGRGAAIMALVLVPLAVGTAAVALVRFVPRQGWGTIRTSPGPQSPGRLTVASAPP